MPAQAGIQLDSRLRGNDGVAIRRGSIAVMPFADASGGPQVRGGTADALAHDVTTRLAKLRSLFVIAQGSTFALAERRIALGICPSSNLALNVYPSLAAHPIDALRRAGVPVSINTDDPSLLQTTLPREYGLCARHFGWGHEVLRTIAATSIDASFADDDVKRALRARLAAW